MVISKSIYTDTHIQSKIEDLLGRLSIKFTDTKPYTLACIHRSIVNERSDYTPEHNERLEFLGDAVLELAVTEQLFADFPEKPEGELTDIRSALVRGKNLAKISKSIGLEQYLLLGKGEEQSGGRENDYLLANTLEAFLGAIYLDSGYREAKKFVDSYVYPSLEKILKYNLTKDFKTLIQEYAQAEYDITPTYEVLSEDGPDHNKQFEVGIYLGEQQVGIGTGTSKKKAQEKAAEDGYMKMQEDDFQLFSQ